MDWLSPAASMLSITGLVAGLVPLVKALLTLLHEKRREPSPETEALAEMIRSLTEDAATTALPESSRQNLKRMEIVRLLEELEGTRKAIADPGAASHGGQVSP